MKTETEINLLIWQNHVMREALEFYQRREIYQVRHIPDHKEIIEAEICDDKGEIARRAISIL